MSFQKYFLPITQEFAEEFQKSVCFHPDFFEDDSQHFENDQNQNFTAGSPVLHTTDLL